MGDLHIDDNIDDNRDSETQLAAAVILIYDYEDYKICWSRSLGGFRYSPRRTSGYSPSADYSQISSSPDFHAGKGGFFCNSLNMTTILFLNAIAFLITSSLRQSRSGRPSGIDILSPKP